jgi:mono/diheme cytochrome c family protein
MNTLMIAARWTAALCTMVGITLGAPHARAASDEVRAQGEYVARLANCVACHSTPGSAAFAGGLKMALPFDMGEIHATNITPDKTSGIGNYTLEDFDRAVRLGIAKDGHMLYPAMPYPSYAKMNEADIAAMYAYFMEVVPAAAASNPPNEIPWPLNMRWPLKVWNFFFAESDRYMADAGKSADWNRGAYLVQGPGHCGACHTPRGLLFNEKGLDDKASNFLAGGMLDYWAAPSLRQEMNTGLGRWSQDDLVAFMKTGHNQHGTAFGSMIEVINNSTQFMSDADLNAMATYLRSLPANADEKPVYAYDATAAADLRAGKFEQRGARVYFQQCIHCHGDDGKGHAPYLPPLAGNPAIIGHDPSSLINVTLNGSALVVVDGLPDSYRMPQFRLLLSDEEIADVVTFMRTSWGNRASAIAAKDVAPVRSSTFPASDRLEILKMK